jgi:hypothetical protein
MTGPTQDEVRASIVPKSDQLNADDLLTGPITVTIQDVRRGNADQPIIIAISGHRPYKPCKSMRRVLVSAYSPEAKRWVGQRMTLFCDPSVKWGGVEVGGIRISHLSGLDGPRSFLLTQTRGKRQKFTVQSLDTGTQDHGNVTTAVLAMIASAETLNELNTIGEMLKGKDQVVRDACRCAYKDQMAALKRRLAGGGDGQPEDRESMGAAAPGSTPSPEPPASGQDDPVGEPPAPAADEATDDPPPWE